MHSTGRVAVLLDCCIARLCLQTHGSRIQDSVAGRQRWRGHNTREKYSKLIPVFGWIPLCHQILTITHSLLLLHVKQVWPSLSTTYFPTSSFPKHFLLGHCVYVHVYVALERGSTSMEETKKKRLRRPYTERVGGGSKIHLNTIRGSAKLCFLCYFQLGQ